ncbi:MAG TPA: DedA family protein [Vicinamibacterales bacterium]|nr:DedA family protein [Vicinamibacterales bacterium]
MSQLIDFVLHFDRHLLQFVQQYGVWVYGILFGIVFAETGLVVTPFLPGDSLLFAVGALSATGVLNLWICYGLLIGAAIMGDAVNYSIGRRIGPRLLGIGEGPVFSHRLINPQHLKRAHEFFERHGGKAVVLARFVPIVRTFLPFVAGAAEMTASSFLFYNIIGGVAWVTICMGAGVLFGNVPIIKENFTLVTIGIVIVSVLPMVFEVIKHKRRRN